MTVCIIPEITTFRQRISEGASNDSGAIVPHSSENCFAVRLWPLQMAMRLCSLDVLTMKASLPLSLMCFVSYFQPGYSLSSLQ